MNEESVSLFKSLLDEGKEQKCRLYVRIVTNPGFEFAVERNANVWGSTN